MNWLASNFHETKYFERVFEIYICIYEKILFVNVSNGREGF